MAISLRGTSTGPNSFAHATTINLPTGTTTGDLTIVVGSYFNLSAVTVPAGWTAAFNFNGQFAFYRVFQVSDPSSLTISAAGVTNAFWQTAAISYIGCDGSTPVDVVNACVSIENGAQASSWGTGYFNAPSVNPNFVNDLLVGCFINGNSGGGGSFAAPSGFTARVSSTAGPNVGIADKQLSSAAATGNAITTNFGGLANDDPYSGVMIALHASGDTPSAQSAATVIWGGVAFHAANDSGPGNVTVPLSEIAAQQNDLICIFAVGSSGTLTAPAGYSTQQSGNGSYLFTRTFQAGDANPAVALSVTARTAVAAVALRLSYGAGSGAPIIDQTNSAAGSGSPTTAVLASLTPGNAHEYLLTWFGQSDTTGSDTWTPPAGLTKQAQNTFGPSAILYDIQPASVPTGTQTAQDTLANQIFGIGLLVSPGPVHPAAKGGFFHSGFTSLPSPGLAAALLGIGAVRRNKVITRRALLGRG